MTLLKIPLKLIALPIAILITAVQWFGIFLTSFGGTILYVLSGLFFLISILSYLMGISTGQDTVQMLVIGFVAFVLPFAAGWLIGMIAALKESLWDFIKS